MQGLTAAWAEAAFVAGAVFYAASAVLLFVQMARGLRAPWSKAGPALLGAGAICHGAYVTVASVVAKVCPVESVHFALSLVALVAAGAYLLARLRWRIDVVGAFVAPVGLTFLLGTRLVNLGQVDTKLPPLFLTFHVAANLVGEALFLLASVAAVLYLFVEKRLKEKRPGGLLGRLPPLDALDQAEHRFLLLGFPLLTIGILTGTAWARTLETGNTSEVLRIVLSYLTWLVFAGVLLLRAAAGWRGRRAAIGTVTGFFFAVLVLVVYFVRPGAEAASHSAARQQGARSGAQASRVTSSPGAS